MLHWSLHPRTLPLRYTWKISRNASTEKVNLLVRVGREGNGGPAGWGEAAPNVRYGETPESLQADFARLLTAGLPHVEDEQDLQELLHTQQPAHALRFALESAFIHYAAARLGQSVGKYLGVQAAPGPVPTAFSLPIMEPGAVPEFVRTHAVARFPLLKLKVNQESGYALLQALTQCLPGHPLLIDGNEAWQEPDSLLQFLEQTQTLPGLQVRLLEQPLPAACTDAYRYLRPRSPFPVFADESVTDTAEFAEVARQFHGVNMKLMKAGGYRNGLHILKQTRAHGLQTMLGCMVETSLGIWSALQVSPLAQVCDLDGFLIVRDEPFGLVQENQGLLTAQAALPALHQVPPTVI
ncbi:dipeptide epimerase [Hymenobacter sp. DG25B]|uniref:dipeptide epimerase n=1 Tax=Hymenobacter sp. DG25B TaxID=1385664 RepID=UPI0005CA81F5|nr:dipeptide epimerase [Hymenobacter sp. DG25B]